MSAVPASPLSLWAAVAPVAPPSGAVVAAVLAFGDVHAPVAPDLVLISLSERRLLREDLRLLLDPAERGRAAEISILWRPSKGEMVRVVDDAQPVKGDRRLGGFPRLAA